MSPLLARTGSWVARLSRRPVVYRMILRAIPRAISLRFDREAGEGLEARFELRVPHPGGLEPARFQIAVKDRRCEVVRGGGQNDVTAVTIAAGDLVRLGSGAIGWPELLSSGRLELSGNPFEALRFPVLFRLPAAAAGGGGAASERPPTPLR